jgi:hypothetical protein
MRNGACRSNKWSLEALYVSRLTIRWGPTCELQRGEVGDPLSPILFNLVADCLTRMVRKAQNNGLITGLADNLIPKGVAILSTLMTLLSVSKMT